MSLASLLRRSKPTGYEGVTTLKAWLTLQSSKTRALPTRFSDQENHLPRRLNPQNPEFILTFVPVARLVKPVKYHIKNAQNLMVLAGRFVMLWVSYGKDP